MSTTTQPPLDPRDPGGLADLLTADEKTVAGSVRRLCEERVDPFVAGWFERGEIADIRGSLGVLGMHLEGYGCAGMSATGYGLACLELEASDSGLRSLVSRWRCSRSGGGAQWSSSSGGCRRWRRARPSTASA
ncbi:hypothetical protein GCM10027445_30480 [Amycolatopsis endophytica]|uniref:Acyl-CoA dehydrogenase/oxidase N-terminal domain-containing protein n=1 Tax=Amycolatopsis endophytica TaxID=860233 RepID=A0A853BAQ5_9PSEU|nr:hypothetical protein [Amycolatopsis endophytica]